MKTEKIYFDESQFNSTLSGLRNFIRSINERPVEGADRLSLAALKRNGIINECFITICKKLSFQPSQEMLKNLLHKSESKLIQIISEMAEAELIRQGAPSVMILSAVTASQPIIREFVSIMVRLTQLLDHAQNLIFKDTGEAIQLMDYITFDNGLAIASDSSIEQLKDVFTVYLTPERKNLLDLLTGLSVSINKINEIIPQAGKYFKPLEVSSDFLTISGGTASPDLSIMKYF